MSGEDCATCEGSGDCWCTSWPIEEIEAEHGEDGCPDCGGEECCRHCRGAGVVE